MRAAKTGANQAQTGLEKSSPDLAPALNTETVFEEPGATDLRGFPGTLPALDLSGKIRANPWRGTADDSHTCHF